MAEAKRADCKDSEIQRKYFWYCYKNLGFPKRVNHAAAAHVDKISGNASFFSIGGFIDEEPGFAYFKSADIDVHKFDVASKTWSLVQTRSRRDDPSLSACAKRRYGHSACSYKGRIYVFGGRNDDDGSMKHVCCFDISTSSWVNCNTSGQVPGARNGHACTLIGSTMFIHGGFIEMGLTFTNTLYGLDLETLIWELYPSNGAHVQERDLHTATAVGKHKIVVFGGRCSQSVSTFAIHSYYDDKFYCYDLRNGRCSEMVTTGYKPVGRRSHVAACYRNSIVYFGGYDSVVDLHFADVFLLNVDTGHISEVKPWGESPSARRRPACAIVGSEVIICGGTSPEPIKGKDGGYILSDHSDTYILNLFPNLQEICISVILTNEIDYSLLPHYLCSYLKELSSLNSAKRKT